MFLPHNRAESFFILAIMVAKLRITQILLDIARDTHATADAVLRLFYVTPYEYIAYLAQLSFCWQRAPVETTDDIIHALLYSLEVAT